MLTDLSEKLFWVTYKVGTNWWFFSFVRGDDPMGAPPAPTPPANTHNHVFVRKDIDSGSLKHNCDNLIQQFLILLESFKMYAVDLIQAGRCSHNTIQAEPIWVVWLLQIFCQGRIMKVVQNRKENIMA